MPNKAMTKMTDLDKSKTVKGWVNKFGKINENLRTKKNAFDKQAEHIVSLLMKEGKKPYKINTQRSFPRKRAEVVFLKNHSELIVDFNNKRHHYKIK